jgi:hypothetical protein
MNSSSRSALNCQHCRHFVPEGRRGGCCNQLNVFVDAGWKACALMIPPFVSTWESLEKAVSFQPALPVLQPLPIERTEVVAKLQVSQGLK